MKAKRWIYVGIYVGERGEMDGVRRMGARRRTRPLPALQRPRRRNERLFGNRPKFSWDEYRKAVQAFRRAVSPNPFVFSYLETFRAAPARNNSISDSWVTGVLM